MNSPAVTQRTSRVPSRAFTIVEMLIVISIIAILAAMIMPAIATARKKAQIKRAQIEMGQIVTAIRGYEADNNRFPITQEAMASGNNDFTFGTYGVVCAGLDTPTGFKTPSGVPCQVLATNSAKGYQTNNAELMAILLDKETFPGTGQKTSNFGHVKNPKKDVYLNANMVSDTTTPGVGPDLVYRDPWGNPYIISIDTAYDGKSFDSFYRCGSVSQPVPAPGNSTGLNGLVNSTDANGNGDNFECNDPIMIWSAGPDKMIDPTVHANEGANKDNVLSWK